MATNQFAAVPIKASAAEKATDKPRRPRKLGQAVKKLAPIRLWSGLSLANPVA